MALPARKQVPHDNDGNTTEPKLHTREQQMHASLPDKSLEPQSRRHASLHPVMHANANTNNNQHNQSTNSRLQQSQHHQSNASTPALHASTPLKPSQANNSQRVALKPVERMHQPPKVSLKPASSIGNNATNKIKAEKVLHKLDENPRQLHANIPRMQPENTKLDDDLQQMDDELLGDEDVVDLEDLIDTEHTTPEYSYESDAFDTPVPDDGFDDDNESSDTDELDDALPEDLLDNAAYNDYNTDNEQSYDSDGTDDIDNNDDYIDDVSDDSSDDYYDDNDDTDDIDDDTDSDDDYLDDDSDTNEESYDDDYIDDTDDELEPSLQDDTANNVNNNNTDSNANTTPDNSISEPSDTTTNDDSSDKESKPTVSGFKAMLADFKKKIKNEIGDNNDDTDDSNDTNENNNDKNDEQKPDDDQKPDDKPTIDNKSPLALILSIITLPFKALMFTLRTASKLMQIIMSAVSMLTVFALIWLILNIPVALHTSSADFDNDEGTLTAESVKYDNGSITFTAVNNSDMIAHADITGSVKAWKPFKRIPVSLFAPVKVMDCTTSYVDMNPNENKEITIQCTGDTGLWMRPTVHITGE